jgi:hypothetical protein
MSTSTLPKRRHRSRIHPAIFFIVGAVIVLLVAAASFYRSQLDLEKRQIAEMYAIGKQEDARQKVEKSRHVSDSKVIYAFTDGLIEDPLENAYQLTTSRFQEQFDLKDFEAMLREHPLVLLPRDPLHARTVGGTSEYDKRRRAVRVKVAHDGQEVSYTLRLEREADRWLVDGLIFDLPGVPAK